MKRKERLNNIIVLLKEHKEMSIHMLAERFKISPITLRQDLQLLEKERLIQRSYGKVLYIDSFYIYGTQNNTESLSFKQRFLKESTEKDKIAKLASQLIWEDSTIYIDESSTTAYMVSYIKQLQRITVITNSLYIMQELSDCFGVRVIILGGILSSLHNSSIGKKSIEQLLSYDIDCCFIGASALDFENGTYENSPAIAEIKYHAVQRATTTILLATHSKFDLTKRIHSIPWSSIKYFITDCTLSKDISVPNLIII